MLAFSRKSLIMTRSGEFGRATMSVQPCAQCAGNSGSPEAGKAPSQTSRNNFDAHIQLAAGTDKSSPAQDPIRKAIISSDLPPVKSIGLPHYSSPNAPNLTLSEALKLTK